jgi:hypothetical protein
VFNSGQVLFGMLALWRATGEPKWMDAARAGLRWLASGMGSDGLWPGGDYRASGTPSYYSHVLWPMLDVGVELQDTTIRDAVIRGVRTIVGRVQDNGSVRGWGFDEGSVAFTHTIAYTIRGIQGCGELLGDDSVLSAAVPALERLVRISELRGGRLPGSLNEAWRPEGNYVCLTGSAQVAECVLLHESRHADLRLVSAAARMLDVVCNVQRLESVFSGTRGAVGGSCPVWGPYMRYRYPNWAAKFLCDGLLRLMNRLEGMS